MADPADKQTQERNIQLRTALANAYSFVESAKAGQSFSALTFEDLLDQQIEQISGKGTDVRPNKLDRLTAIESDVKSAVDQIKKLPDDAFARPDSNTDVNTPPNDDGTSG